MLRWVLLTVFILIFLLFYSNLLSRVISHGKLLGYHDALKNIVKKEQEKHGKEKEQK